MVGIAQSSRWHRWISSRQIANGLLIEHLLAAGAPTAVDRLTSRAVLFTKLPELRKSVALEASRSAFRSSNVELTKTPKVRLVIGIAEQQISR